MKHKLGVIGYGTMGSWHAENVRDRIADLDVVAVYDIDPEKREKAAKDGFCAICGAISKKQDGIFRETRERPSFMIGSDKREKCFKPPTLGWRKAWGAFIRIMGCPQVCIPAPFKSLTSCRCPYPKIRRDGKNFMKTS